MARGPKKHLKRLNAPKHWMLSKMDGIWAPRPSQGPHKLRECLPLILILRNRLKYALTGKETKMICMERLVKVDGKVRTDPTFPAGFMDVVEIPKADDQFRLIFDTKGRYVLHRISDEEKKFKLCRVRHQELTIKKVPYVVTHDGRTIRYPDPLIKVRDTVKVDIATNKIIGFSKFEVGNVCVITGGKNIGRVGVIQVFSPSSSFSFPHPHLDSEVTSKFPILQLSGHLICRHNEDSVFFGMGGTRSRKVAY